MSNSGQFQKGYTYREPKPYWDKYWLFNEYIIKGRSTQDIADEFKCRDNNIQYFLKKHNIKSRNMSEIRKIKRWGSLGKNNPMYGMSGKKNPNWKGGVSAERQRFYESRKWKRACLKVWKRDKAACVRCGKHRDILKNNLHVHHIRSFAHKETRANMDNLILVCVDCHRFIHSKKNVYHEYIQ